MKTRSWYSWYEQTFHKEMSPWQSEFVQDGPKNLPLKFGQIWVSNTWDITDIEFLWLVVGRPTNNYKPTGHLIRYQNLLITQLKNLQNKSKNYQIDPKMLKIRQIDRKYPKNATLTAKILLTKKSAELALKILLLVLKPTLHLVPRCGHNLGAGLSNIGGTLPNKWSFPPFKACPLPSVH